MEKKNKWVVLSLAIAALIFQSCADKTTEDSNQQIAAYHAGKIQEILGTYSGTLDIQGNPTLPMSITVDIDSTSSGANNSGAQQVGFRGTVSLMVANADVRQLGYSQAFYDIVGHNYNFQMPVQLEDGSSGTVVLFGSFANGKMTGQIYANGFDYFGGDFALGKNAIIPSNQSLNSARAAAENRTRNLSPLGTSFSWVGVDPTGEKLGPGPIFIGDKPVRSRLELYNVIKTQQSFIDYFLPLKVVDALIRYNSVTNADTYNYIEYPQAQLDRNSGRLVGTNGLAKLDCYRVTQKDGEQDWQCTVQGVNAGQYLFKPDAPAEAPSLLPGGGMM